ncbi:MAG: hypothetical protein WCF60_03820 [Anaerobacillus sp.]
MDEEVLWLEDDKENYSLERKGAMRVNRNYFFVINSIGLFMMLVVYDLFENAGITWWENAFQALFTTVIFMFFSWAWKSKEYKKKS